MTVFPTAAITPEPDRGAGDAGTLDAHPDQLDLASAPSRRSHRRIAPVLAAAAVAAVAIGAVVIATDQPAAHQRHNPPASHVSRPPEPSNTPTPTPTTTPTQTIAAPPYLPAGQTGSRDQVPWSAVGPGWRLLQRQYVGEETYGRELYLYDPAGGRYLITDALPVKSSLLAWSPDGRRAMVESWKDSTFQQFDLRTGRVVSTAVLPYATFSTYTMPRGLAMIVSDDSNPKRLQYRRYSLDGTLELTFSNPALQAIGGPLYTPDGSQLIADTTGALVLLGNDGRLIRQFPMPAGYSLCMVSKWWTNSTALEVCYQAGDRAFDALFLQPLAGGKPTVLVDSVGPDHMGFNDAWQLSNGDVLLQVESGCGYGGNAILDGKDGSTRPLRLPAGVSQPGRIVNMDGDVATFLQQNIGCGGSSETHFSLIDYNMATGTTRKLIDSQAMIVNWPGDPR